MPLFLLDRDGVVIVNRPDNVKSAADIDLIAGAAGAIGRLNRAGYKVAICTNQPEVARGAVTREQMEEVHAGLKGMLAESGAVVDLILCCEENHKSRQLKPSGGMLAAAIARFGEVPSQTPFVGDQLDDLRAGFHAGCRRILVRTGLGRKTLRRPLPSYVFPVAVFEDLAGAVDAELGTRRQ